MLPDIYYIQLPSLRMTLAQPVPGSHGSSALSCFYRSTLTRKTPGLLDAQVTTGTDPNSLDRPVSLKVSG